MRFCELLLCMYVAFGTCIQSMAKTNPVDSISDNEFIMYKFDQKSGEMVNLINFWYRCSQIFILIIR